MAGSFKIYLKCDLGHQATSSLLVGGERLSHIIGPGSSPDGLV